MVMVPNPPSSGERLGSGKGAGSGAQGRPERAPGTPRRDGGAGKDKAMQDPGLKDYVRRIMGYIRSYIADIVHTATRRMSGQGSLWISLQSIQLGHWRGSSYQAD